MPNPYSTLAPLDELAAIVVEGNPYFFRWLETIHDDDAYSVESKIEKVFETGYHEVHASFDVILAIILRVAAQSGRAYDKASVIKKLVLRYANALLGSEGRAFRAKHGKDLPSDDKEQRLAEIMVDLQKRCPTEASASAPENEDIA